MDSNIFGHVFWIFKCWQNIYCRNTLNLQELPNHSKRIFMNLRIWKLKMLEIGVSTFGNVGCWESLNFKIFEFEFLKHWNFTLGILEMLKSWNVELTFLKIWGKRAPETYEDLSNCFLKILNMESISSWEHEMIFW